MSIKNKAKNITSKEDTLIFINSRTGQILYNKIFEQEIDIIINYNKDLILLSFLTNIFIELEKLCNYKNNKL